MNNSIKRRLLSLLILAICGVWCLVSWRIYIHTKYEVEELFDANLAQSAQILLGLIQHELEEQSIAGNKQKIIVEQPLFGHQYEHQLGFLVRSSDGHILIRSADTPLFPQLPSFSNYSAEDGYLWRVFTRKADGFIVQTAERHNIRDELISKIMFSTLLILLITLPLLAVLIWISISHSLKPLQAVANEIAARIPNQLQTLDLKKIPIEIRVLTKAINNLFNRLNKAFENERSFTADAAHELRTPLAGLKIQAQVAQRAIDTQQRELALQQILIGVDRATHLVSQLLSLARLDATQTLVTTQLDMLIIIKDIISKLTPQALEKDIDLGLENTATSYIISAHHTSISIMLCNLVHNAIRYTPRAGEVTVSLSNIKADKLTLMIKDTGPGIPLTLQKQVFERFYRGECHNVPGSGLGLSIVQQVAQLHNLEIQLNNISNDGGLCVRVDFVIGRSLKYSIFPIF
jgi:two-component system sensor histidine kinase QseC